MKFVSLILLFVCLFPSCEYVESRAVTVRLAEEHLWESYSGKSMWYNLKYYDGDEIKTKFIPSTDKEVVVRVKRGATGVFTAYPLGSLTPSGGGLSPYDGDKVSLTFSQGKLASVLLDVVPYNQSYVDNFPWKGALSLLPDHYDEDELLYLILEGGALGDLKSTKTSKVSLTLLPSGYYIPELDEDPKFNVTDSSVEVTMSLYPGIHRFTCLETGISVLVGLYADGTYDSQVYEESPW